MRNLEISLTLSLVIMRLLVKNCVRYLGRLNNSHWPSYDLNLDINNLKKINLKKEVFSQSVEVL